MPSVIEFVAMQVLETASIDGCLIDSDEEEMVARELNIFTKLEALEEEVKQAPLFCISFVYHCDYKGLVLNGSSL
ncbi:hypothetical protein MRB53_003253 [Persea americana]|uniref:Uncharacterized protein n=1 Tax=Persea americana TaxID=3435 RepID=A0ACC2MWX0_PERAE|nr:hypothetical protein MRB53_003253 [Persea americana]